MLIALKSDFHDYYDHAFVARWQERDVVYERLTRSGPNRVQMYKMLNENGLRTPRHGTVRELLPRLAKESTLGNIYPKIAEFVVHTDIYAHCGEGKVKVGFEQALNEHPNDFAVEFLPTMAGLGAVSYRYLHIGFERFWLRYTSCEDWRSNVGEGTVELLVRANKNDVRQVYSPWLMRLAPLVAIDFLLIRGDMYAIDLNIAPQLSSTGVEKHLRPKQVLSEIKDWYKAFPLSAQANKMLAISRT